MKVFTLLGVLMSVSVYAAPTLPTVANNIETSSLTQIDRLIVYGKRGNGDVFLSTDANSEQCADGYFIDKASAGYEGSVSMLIAAYQAKTQIQISGYTDSFWSGSTGQVCALYNVTYP
ncbi:hypothetical protein C1S86_23850 [Vibrio parahaemolyticus]|uniref:hypothetical protein n=1 Tax=Vibrio parahaemolyticus TaxID=670 RepID=UPI00046F53B6|nr:hypothetical protein [Vibrio parahaemolyticus]EJE4149822.1 hypothetical protein [Vibrio parahaemolyticus]ELB2105078.1 hypothetical protein [Vibrio parahaemolyticus]MDG2997092.1 hypothetical protein [Vibrio parahaemolyticus]MQP57744.1 hypothetical protein [Vibrio parahaemolyticus]MQZ03199.1 hypothetical protein [Vibrio parahaemolyticus]